MKEKFIKWIPVLALVSFVTAVFLIADDIPPLKQTMEEVIQEYRNGYTIFERTVS